MTESSNSANISQLLDWRCYHEQTVDVNSSRDTLKIVKVCKNCGGFVGNGKVQSIKEPLMNFHLEIPPFEIFEFLLEDEQMQQTYQIYSKFPILDVNKFVQQKQERRQLINRIFEQGEKLNQRKLTIHLACLFFDKLIYQRHVKKCEKLSMNELEKKASMCVIVASKQDELDDKIPMIREVQKLSQFKFNYQEGKLEESSILKDLNWTLNFITPLHLVQSLLSLGVVFTNDRDLNSEKPIEEQLIARVRKFSNYFADFSMKYEELMKFRPSKLALSCVLCARRYAQIEPAWNPIFTDITGYQYERDNIIDIQNVILGLYKSKCDQQIKEKEKLPSNGRISSVLEHNQNIMNDSTVIQSQQKLEKPKEDRHDSASKGMCGLDTSLLDLVPVVSGQQLEKSESKSRDNFQSSNQVAIVRIQPLHQISSKPRSKRESGNLKKESTENVNKENQKMSLMPIQAQSPPFSTVQLKKGSIDSNFTKKSQESSSLRTTLNNKNIPKPMLPHIPSNKIPDNLKSSNNLCNIQTAPQSRCTSIYSNQQYIHQQVPEALKQRNQSESNLHSGNDSSKHMKQSSIVIQTSHNKFLRGSTGQQSTNNSLTRKNKQVGIFPSLRDSHGKNPLNIHTATKRLEQIKNKYQSENIINEKTKSSTKNSRNQSISFNNKNSTSGNQLIKTKNSNPMMCESHHTNSDDQLDQRAKQFKTQQENRKPGIVLEEDEIELERTITQGEINCTDITQNFSECVEINPNEQSFIKKPILSNPKTLINIDPQIKKNTMVEKALKEIYKQTGATMGEEKPGRNKKLSNKFSINNTYRTSGDFREAPTQNNSSNNQVKFSHIKSSSGNMLPQQEKNTSISNLKQINYIQRNISQVSTSHRGESMGHINMPQLFKQKMVEQCKNALKETRQSHTANQSYMKGRRVSKQQQFFKHQKLHKQKSLSTNKSLASISAQFQINIVNLDEPNLEQLKTKDSVERVAPSKAFQDHLYPNNISSSKNLFDRRSHYIRSEQIEKRSFIRDHHCLTKKSSPKNLQSSSLLQASVHNGSKEDLKREGKLNYRSGLKSWRKDSDIIQIFEQYHSKFENNPSTQRSNNTSQYGSQLNNTKFNLFKSKKPRKAGPQLAYNQSNTTKDTSMIENIGSQKSKLSLQPVSSTNLQAKNLQNSRQSLIPQMKFVSNILNASKELMNNNMILNSHNNQSHFTNHSNLSCTNKESKHKILSDRGKGFHYDENKAKELFQKEEAKFKRVVGTFGGSKKNQLIKGRF